MKHTRQFNEFVNERVTKYKSYVSSKFRKNSNLDLNDAIRKIKISIKDICDGE